MHDEQHLLAQCRQGNKDAFYLLVSPYLARAYRLAFTILRSHYDAEDVVQNSLLEVYRAISENKEIRHFASWFYRLVTHRAIDMARKIGKERQYAEISDVLSFLSNSHHLPVDEVINKEEEQELLAHILKLDIKHRVILVLYYYQNMKISEIAELLQIKEGTVKSRLFQARNLLYQYFQKERKEELR